MFINVILRDLPTFSGNAAISYHRLNNNGLGGGEADFINLTVDNAGHLFNANRADGIARIYNSTFSNVNAYHTFYPGWPDDRENYTAIFTDCNFDNSTNGFGDPANDINSNSSLVRPKNFPPLFQDKPNNNYRLQAGSQLINAGGSLTAFLPEAGTDFDGGVRPQSGGYDIGAFEFGSAPPVGGSGKTGVIAGLIIPVMN